MNETFEASGAAEVNEYDVAQALGHPFPAPRSSVVWVATAIEVVSEGGGEFTQAVAVSEESALEALKNRIVEYWKTGEGYCPIYHPLDEDGRAERRIDEFVQDQSRDEIFSMYTAIYDGDRGVTVSQVRVV